MQWDSKVCASLRLRPWPRVSRRASLSSLLNGESREVATEPCGERRELDRELFDVLGPSGEWNDGGVVVVCAT